MLKHSFKPKKEKRAKNKFSHWLIIFALLAWLYKFLNRFFSPQSNHKSLKLNFLDFFKQEKKEFKQWRQGKESFKQYCLDSSSLFEDYFIPHLGNNYKPKILRPRSLITIILILALFKAIVVSYLFFIYPNKARMSADMSEQTLELINKSRQENGLAPLKFNSILGAAALAKAQDMIAENYFAHRSPGGLWPWDWINRDQYPYIYVGENLAMNFSSAQAAHNALMQSPSHKKNILNKKYTEAGIAVVSGKIDGRQTNVLVELFATPAPTVSLAKTNNSKNKSELIVEQKSQPKQQLLSEQSKTADLPPANKPAALPTNNNSTTGSSSEDISMPTAKPTTASKTLAIERSNKLPKTNKSTQVLASQTNQAATTTATIARLPLAKLLGTKIAPPRPRFTDPDSLAAEQHLNSEVKYFQEKNGVGWSVIEYTLKFSYWLFTAILLLLTFALAVNIFIRINIQHKGVIIQTLLAIIFISALLLIRLHPVEYLLSYVMVV